MPTRPPRTHWSTLTHDRPSRPLATLLLQRDPLLLGVLEVTDPAAIEAAKRILEEAARVPYGFLGSETSNAAVVARALLEAEPYIDRYAAIVRCEVVEAMARGFQARAEKAEEANAFLRNHQKMTTIRAEKAEAEVSLLKEERALRESIAASQGQRILDVEAELAACERSLLGVKAQRDDALGDLAALRKAVQETDEALVQKLASVHGGKHIGVAFQQARDILRAKVGPHLGP